LEKVIGKKPIKKPQSEKVTESGQKADVYFWPMRRSGRKLIFNDFLL
jgi:hypothetical protein